MVSILSIKVHAYSKVIFMLCTLKMKIDCFYSLLLLFNVTGADTTNRNMRAHHNVSEAIEVSTAAQTDQRSTSGESALLSTVKEDPQHSTTIGTDELPTSREAAELSCRRESTGLSSFSTNVVENEDTNMVDHVEHPFILSAEEELPFTYLASLSAKWAAVQGKESFVQGKIKVYVLSFASFCI